MCCFEGKQALSTITKVWKEPIYLSVDEWIKMWYIYNGVLFGHQNERNLVICNYMDGTGGYYAK